MEIEKFLYLNLKVYNPNFMLLFNIETSSSPI